MVDVISSGLLSCLNAAPAVPPTQQECWDIFQSIHQESLANSEMKSFLLGEGFSLKLDRTVLGLHELIFCNHKNGIALLIEQEEVSNLAWNSMYAAYAHGTDKNYAAQLAAKLVKWREGQLPEPFEDDEGWETVVWSVDDEGPQVGFSVGHNKEFEVTKIWGHQIHIGNE